MKILGTGKYLPEKVLTNADLEKRVDTTDEWIVTRTGIRERRIASDEESASDMGVIAAQEAISKAGLTSDDIDLIIVATVTPDSIFPSTACHIQNKIGAKRAAAFDLQAACSGFLYGLVTADQFLRSGGFKNALIIGTEKLSSILDWNDRSTCVLFGDGAGAVVAQSSGEHNKLLSYELGANGSYHGILYLNNGNAVVADENMGKQYIQMSGQDVFKQAVTEMSRASERVLEKAGLKISDLKYVISHQANIRIIDALANKLKVPKEKCYVNVQKYGNMSAACIPVALDEVEENEGLKKGDKLLLVAFGGGLTWAACILEW